MAKFSTFVSASSEVFGKAPLDLQQLAARSGIEGGEKPLPLAEFIDPKVTPCSAKIGSM